jgi:hypothetical protein
MSKSFLHLSFFFSAFMPALTWAASFPEKDLQKIITEFRASCDCDSGESIACKEPFSIKTFFDRSTGHSALEYTKDFRVLKKLRFPRPKFGVILF